jgi:hypothetical protein
MKKRQARDDSYSGDAGFWHELGRMSMLCENDITKCIHEIGLNFVLRFGDIVSCHDKHLLREKNAC